MLRNSMWIAFLLLLPACGGGAGGPEAGLLTIDCSAPPEPRNLVIVSLDTVLPGADGKHAKIIKSLIPNSWICKCIGCAGK